MGKNQKIETFVKELVGCGRADVPACYQAFFVCFNQGKYYEAHDVLEYAWLLGPTHEVDGVMDFFKALIQLAGAFVHLQKHYFRPHHYKFSHRLHPAARLLGLARRNLQQFLPETMGLDVRSVLTVCHQLEAYIVQSAYRQNPWRPESLVQFELSPKDGKPEPQIIMKTL